MKNAFEASGSSPGLLEIKRKIADAFERARTLPLSPPASPKQDFYTAIDEARFLSRAQKLILASLGSQHVCKERVNVHHIAVPEQTADEIIAEITGGGK